MIEENELSFARFGAGDEGDNMDKVIEAVIEGDNLKLLLISRTEKRDGEVRRRESLRKRIW